VYETAAPLPRAASPRGDADNFTARNYGLWNLAERPPRPLSASETAAAEPSPDSSHNSETGRCAGSRRLPGGEVRSEPPDELTGRRQFSGRCRVCGHRGMLFFDGSSYVMWDHDAPTPGVRS
jgi:hypothetical protein